MAALDRVLESSTTVVHLDVADFDATVAGVRRDDDHDSSVTDHVSAVLADDREIDHVFTVDVDHVRTLGFTVVPTDTGDVSARSVRGLEDRDDDRASDASVTRSKWPCHRSGGGHVNPPRNAI